MTLKDATQGEDVRDLHAATTSWGGDLDDMDKLQSHLYHARGAPLPEGTAGAMIKLHGFLMDAFVKLGPADFANGDCTRFADARRSVEAFSAVENSFKDFGDLAWHSERLLDVAENFSELSTL